eukprot:augustus_masked-scaffold_7-processed-gene-9.58-mRNA-1 protein AED:0.03 eAED:0.04 QI:0/-1/0/1/-1/1/1/0/359
MSEDKSKNDEKQTEESMKQENGISLLEKTSISTKDYYFDSYSHIGIHQEMLQDRVRTETYRDAILRNPSVFENRVVMDVGCGTGILSLFAAKAGAKHVYAIEYSKVAEIAKQIIKDNGYSDKITVIQSKVEDPELTKIIKENVDIIISEWMGYCLLYEGMLDSVLYARDTFMQVNSFMFPDYSEMFIVGIEDHEYKEQHINYWDNVYGFDFSCIKPLAMLEPLVETVPAKQVSTTSDKLIGFDLLSMKKEDTDFTSEFEISFKQTDYIHAFVIYWDAEFTQSHKKIGFSTSPRDEYTHWKQTTFYIPDELTGYSGDVVKGKISFKQNEKNKRELDITISYTFENERQKVTRENLLYRMI